MDSVAAVVSIDLNQCILLHDYGINKLYKHRPIYEIDNNVLFVLWCPILKVLVSVNTVISDIQCYKKPGQSLGPCRMYHYLSWLVKSQLQ